MAQTIGIIGAGNIGRGIATHLAKTPYRVLLTNSRGADSLKETVASIGGTLQAADLKETVAQSDVIFLSVPWTSLKELANQIGSAKNKLIIDTTNNIVSVSPFQLADLAGKTTGETVAELFPGNRVVKAFNTLAAATLATPTKNTAGNTVIFMSGDDEAAKTEVSEIVKAMDFTPVDLGSFKDGAKLQEIGKALSGIELIKVAKK